MQDKLSDREDCSEADVTYPWMLNRIFGQGNALRRHHKPAEQYEANDPRELDEHASEPNAPQPIKSVQLCWPIAHHDRTPDTSSPSFGVLERY